VRNETNIFRNIDWWIIGIYMALVFIGWLNIYAAVYDEQHQSIFDFSQSYGKQLIWIITGFAIGLFILLIDSKFFSQFAYGIYGISILLLIAVLIAGQEVSGAKAWFVIGSFKLQPSEITKFATNLAIAKYLSSIDIDMRKISTRITAIFIFLIPTAIILLQNDTGSAMVYAAFVFVMYREGLSGNILILGLIAMVLFVLALLINQFVLIGIAAGILAILFFFMRRNTRNIITLISILAAISAFTLTVDYLFDNVLEDHQRSRINVLLGKELDLKGAGYNVNQSKIAIGSGGFIGKGFLQGTQTKYNFVPEQSTDFIFCTVGEEWGFIGTSIVVGLFLFLLIRIIILAERQRSRFARIYGYGVALILFLHFLINIGMTIGLLPVIGIPLPFISYGGSSLWSFTVLLFIFIKQDSNRLNLI
jgi:rod shape determining protein RodA